MEAKSLKGWIIAGTLTACGLIAAPVIDSLVKEGKFPEGLGAVLSTLWGWLTVQVSVPLWVALLILLPIGISLCGLIMTKRQLLQGSEPVSTPPELDQEMRRLSRHNHELTDTKARLERELFALSEIRRNEQDRNAALEAEIASQGEANADLKQQLVTMSHTPKVAEVEVEIPAYAFNTLNAIATLTNRGSRPNLITLRTAVGSRVEVEGAIDILRELLLVQSTDTAGMVSYSLTPKGRAYYLEQKSEKAG